jgi:hypothetical protein
MKTHVLKKLVRKSAPLVAAALLLSLTTAAWAQLPRNRGTLYTDGCYYILKANLVIPAGQPGSIVLERQGCRVFGRDGRLYYHDFKTQIWQDELTGTKYAFANRGWIVLGEYRTQQQQTNQANTDGLNNQEFLDPGTLKTYNHAQDTIDKGTATGMGLCGGNSSDFNKCLDNEGQVKRQANANADQADRQKQDFDKAMDRTAETKREAERAWNKRR